MNLDHRSQLRLGVLSCSVALLGALLLPAPAAHAALGSNAASIVADRDQLQASVRVTAHALYEVHELTLPTGTALRGISLEQIAAATKISVRSLEAIERGDFSKLPGGIYNTSYIRQYARAIDYDESNLLAFYAKSTAGGDGSAQRPANRPNVAYPGLRTAST